MCVFEGRSTWATFSVIYFPVLATKISHFQQELSFLIVQLKIVPMSLQKKMMIIIPLIGIVIGGVIGLYMYNKPHADLHQSEAAFKMKATELLETYSSNETEANAKFLNKVIEVTGVVTDKEITESGDVIVFLKDAGEMFGVSCAFVPEQKEEATALEIGTNTYNQGSLHRYAHGCKSQPLCSRKITICFLQNSIITNYKQE